MFEAQGFKLTACRSLVSICLIILEQSFHILLDGCYNLLVALAFSNNAGRNLCFVRLLMQFGSVSTHSSESTHRAELQHHSRACRWFERVSQSGRYNGLFPLSFCVGLKVTPGNCRNLLFKGFRFCSGAQYQSTLQSVGSTFGN